MCDEMEMERCVALSRLSSGRHGLVKGVANPNPALIHHHPLQRMTSQSKIGKGLSLGKSNRFNAYWTRHWMGGTGWHIVRFI